MLCIKSCVRLPVDTLARKERLSFTDVSQVTFHGGFAPRACTAFMREASVALLHRGAALVRQRTWDEQGLGPADGDDLGLPSPFAGGGAGRGWERWGFNFLPPSLTFPLQRERGCGGALTRNRYCQIEPVVRALPLPLGPDPSRVVCGKDSGGQWQACRPRPAM